jgi:hypothetical protein
MMRHVTWYHSIMWIVTALTKCFYCKHALKVRVFDSISQRAKERGGLCSPSTLSAYTSKDLWGGTVLPVPTLSWQSLLFQSAAQVIQTCALSEELFPFFVMSKLAQAVMLPTYIWEANSLNLGQVTRNSDWGFTCFSSATLGKCQYNIKLMTVQVTKLPL